MKNNLINLAAFIMILLLFAGCNKKDYSLGDLTAPSDLVITTELIGKDATHPNGDGSGDVKITVTGKNALSYKVDYDSTGGISLEYLSTGTVIHNYAIDGLHTYTITAVAYGAGGTSSSVTTDVTVQSDFTPDPAIVQNLTGGSSKTWIVDKSVPGHFGVGPWAPGSITPEWWSAAVDEKVACCNCFYTAQFKFTKVSSTSYTIQVTSPDGAFTKTGSLTTLPGIPGSGAEACYSYGGGTGSFTFKKAGSGVTSSSSTHTSILLNSNSTYIGYGALQKEYEIFQITPTFMYLRVQGTETGNAWYLKMKAI